MKCVVTLQNGLRAALPTRGGPGRSAPEKRRARLSTKGLGVATSSKAPRKRPAFPAVAENGRESAPPSHDPAGQHRCWGPTARRDARRAAVARSPSWPRARPVAGQQGRSDSARRHAPMRGARPAREHSPACPCHGRPQAPCRRDGRGKAPRSSAGNGGRTVRRCGGPPAPAARPALLRRILEPACCHCGHLPSPNCL